jgi:hypothetical protein
METLSHTLLPKNDDTDCEEIIINLSRQIHLVLLHPTGDSAATPKHTNLWFNGRRLKSHHHVRVSVDKDFRRFARFLAGETGLSLSVSLSLFCVSVYLSVPFPHRLFFLSFA